MQRSGKVYNKNNFCGIVSETDDGYFFSYQKEYLQSKEATPISETLP